MHAPQGVFTHTNDETLKKIQAIENKGPWMSRIRSVQASAEVLGKTDAAYERLHKESIRFDMEIEQKEKSKYFQQEILRGASAALVEQYETQINTLKSQKKSHSETTGLATGKRPCWYAAQRSCCRQSKRIKILLIQ
jgi:hypothetical protein